MTSEVATKIPKLGDQKRLDTVVCQKCDKKLKMFNTYQCRCGHNFCNKHRFHDQHNCEYDYKSEAKRQLAEDNPKVAPKKL